ncbi:MAG: hypothetical protein ILP02_04185, partial [Clostridia bacterium]|nr:hypothetical protein [Clostridia bacterium]
MKKLSALIIAVIFSAMLVLSSACNIIAKGDLTSADPTQSTQSSSDPSDEPKPSGRAVDLMSDVTSTAVESVSLGVEYADAYNAFAAKLFNLLYEGKNELISPLSIELALSMTANGADGATKTQMENVLFSGGDIDKFNAYNKAYIKSLESVNDISVKVANSIWFNDDPLFSVEHGFLQANADYYNAGAFNAPFDLATLADINGWVSDKTEGMIIKIIDDISKDAVMYLINALL